MMKKFLLLCLCCAVFVSLFSCDIQKGDMDTNNIFFDDHVMDDSSMLDNVLTKEYDLNELKEFFDGRSVNEEIVFSADKLPLSFSEVNQKFPVEIIRTGEYSVYKVNQGGCFYVFWIKPLDEATLQPTGEPCVYFSAYITLEDVSITFDSLVCGTSTAEDVRKIDPFVEFCFLQSSGTFSYSYLDKETVLQIEYYSSQDLNGLKDLIVKEIKVIPRETAPSSYGIILTKDIP